MKTSSTHPIRIAEIPYPVSGGVIGVTFCPGKVQPWGTSGPWSRNLGIDLDAIQQWGATTLISLIEPAELISVRVPALGAEAAARGLAWHHLPIVDQNIPDARWELAWKEVAPCLHGQLQSGGRLVVHCMGGLGRAGMIAARLLAEAGVHPASAIAIVRERRSQQAIETSEQERYIWRVARYITKLRELVDAHATPAIKEFASAMASRQPWRLDGVTFTKLRLTAALRRRWVSFSLLGITPDRIECELELNDDSETTLASSFLLVQESLDPRHLDAHVTITVEHDGAYSLLVVPGALATVQRAGRRVDSFREDLSHPRR